MFGCSHCNASDGVVDHDNDGNGVGSLWTFVIPSNARRAGDVVDVGR